VSRTLFDRVSLTEHGSGYVERGSTPCVSKLVVGINCRWQLTRRSAQCRVVLIVECRVPASDDRRSAGPVECRVSCGTVIDAALGCAHTPPVAHLGCRHERALPGVPATRDDTRNPVIGAVSGIGTLTAVTRSRSHATPGSLPATTTPGCKRRRTSPRYTTPDRLSTLHGSAAGTT